MGEANSEVWDANRNRVFRNSLVDAIAHIPSTPAGSIWVGSFDEGVLGPTVGRHGLVRFAPSLQPDWLYPENPWESALPAITDCYSLNVAEETVHCYAYLDFHLITVARRDGG